MLDFLVDGSTLRGLLAVQFIGAERLAAERGASHGEALEAAVLASLQVLVTALSMDADMVAGLREQGISAGSGGGGGGDGDMFLSTPDTVLLRDMQQCAAVLGYVR